MARDYHAPHLTQEDLAAMLGVARSTLGKWEARNEIPVKQLSKAATILGLPEQWFYVNDNTPPPFSTRSNLATPATITGTAVVINKDQALNIATRSMVRTEEVLLTVVRGVAAGIEGGDCVFHEVDFKEEKAYPSFLVSGDPDNHAAYVVDGTSMYPRIDHAEEAIVRFTRAPRVGSIVVSRRPDGAEFIKVLRSVEGRLELHSLNEKAPEQFPPISNLEGWTFVGEVVAILKTYDPGRPNIEWDFGRTLRA